MKTWLRWLALLLIVVGVVLFFFYRPLAIVLLVIGIVLLFLLLLPREEPGPRWPGLSELEPEAADRVVDEATKFAGITEVRSVLYPRVIASHTRIVNVLGVDGDGEQVVVGVDPVTNEVTKMVRLCPRKAGEATDVQISEEYAEARCRDFLKRRGLALSENYVGEEARVVSLGPWKRWRFVWRHVVNGVRILPDFVMMEVNATEAADVISYSKVDHDVEVSLTPQIELRRAVVEAREFMPEVEKLELSSNTLAVVYPNNFFRQQVWEWSDSQALCWILRYAREGKHTIDIWVDAATGQIHGGEVCHTPAPEVFGIDAPGDTHMQSHTTQVWSPFLDMMRFDVSSFDWTNGAAGFSEATISNAIANSRYFVVEGHGDVTPTAEMMAIAYQGSADAQAFTPDEVPANNLRFVLLDTCQSGEDGTGLDFKDTFISQGADVFIGFDDYMCAWAYETSLLSHLAQGTHLANAHNLADAEVSPSYPIVITYDVSCLNKVRLAPLLVTVTRSPTGTIIQGNSFSVSTAIVNREDVDHTAATNVQAKLILPAGFSILAGANPQNLGAANWNSPRTATWSVRAPFSSGAYTLDVEVWSDNLGVAVDDPDHPYHKFGVHVVSIIEKVMEILFGIFRQFPRGGY